MAGIAARAQEGHYPIDGRLQAENEKHADSTTFDPLCPCIPGSLEQAVFDEIRSGKFAGQASGRRCCYAALLPPLFWVRFVQRPSPRRRVSSNH